ncbi:hypothetical protein Tsubulata_006078 [Turnera subulata]|uniref:Histidine-containing phosphotransfer protein n=1 Tax=Turnera subulata TaxID=218843 RepID=A0A9Q0J7C8_9ROSI|nr:hypothetical protein Tsubulata_006078 [Turnera subulata]
MAGIYSREEENNRDMPLRKKLRDPLDFLMNNLSSLRNCKMMLTQTSWRKEKHPLDFNKLDGYMHQFKGSCSSIGAKKVKAECTLFREYCRVGNGEGCMRAFQQLKKEYATLKRKLEAYFQLARQAGPVETARRPK